MNSERSRLLLAIFFLFVSPMARTETIHGITANGDLITFDSSLMGNISAGSISGLGSDTIRALDSRPASGDVFAVSNTNRLYVINPLGGPRQAALEGK
jgi:hypothetical protein